MLIFSEEVGRIGEHVGSGEETVTVNDTWKNKLHFGDNLDIGWRYIADKIS